MKKQKKYPKPPRRYEDSEGNVKYANLQTVADALGVSDVSVWRALKGLQGTGILVKIYGKFPNIMSSKQRRQMAALVASGYKMKVFKKKGH